MEEIIQRLIKRHHTNCPFRLAQELGIHIRYHDLGEQTRGIYYRKLRRRFIVIHDKLTDEWKRFVCAHELGHDRLHKGISRFFLEEHTFFNPGKFERQANVFAVRLLTAGDHPEPGETVEQLCARNGIPEEMRHYYGT
ncbi:ImmA/IrrE family metallo-endopeptidase [Paenibacillus filicis]|uniref:ImmA/IrrE family metallo-endopeptidase n=1 Tax=Paenibacillus filicis TaxID=669464 RepID=A0ABU9DUD5_9BACL